MTPNGTPAAAAAVPAAAADGSALADEFGAGLVLVSDLRTGVMLLNHARYRALEALGVRPADVNLVSVAIAATGLDLVGGAVRRGSRALVKPSRGDVWLGAGLVDDLLHEVAGPGSRDVTYGSALIAFALLSKRSGPAVVRSARGATEFSRRTATAFHHRYGYLIAARARRAQRRLRDRLPDQAPDTPDRPPDRGGHPVGMTL